jgi:hypothetical protein
VSQHVAASPQPPIKEWRDVSATLAMRGIETIGFSVCSAS